MTASERERPPTLPMKVTDIEWGSTPDGSVARNATTGVSSLAVVSGAGVMPTMVGGSLSCWMGTLRVLVAVRPTVSVTVMTILWSPGSRSFCGTKKHSAFAKTGSTVLPSRVSLTLLAGMGSGSARGRKATETSGRGS